MVANGTPPNFQKVNEHCFERCVPKPGTSLSSGEQTCYSQCMDKYLAAWNAVSHQYLAQAQKGMIPGP
jgi:import inner membrane translocase subunit TIM13